MTDWRNWETLLHYKGAIFGVLGLLGLLGYAIFGWSDVESVSNGFRVFAAILAAMSFALMWHYSKDPDATKVWLDSLPDDGRDVFKLTNVLSAYSLKCQNLKVIVKI